ncbi:hypothetical protein [Streptomyces sp. NPDC056632]|uniref:hypothetical protein n=1 Tax=Streptomyces sp. NPDC056632 TaxID=3345884 RepID=UPI0036B81828
MLPADVFAAYATGALFAHAVGHEPRKGDRRRVLAFFAFLFAPVATLLLLLFPGWRTMYVLDAPPLWLVCSLGPVQVLLGLAGFLRTRMLLRLGRARHAEWETVAGWAAVLTSLVHGWDGSGYRRVLSSSEEMLLGWGAADAARFLLSPVGVSVVLLGAVLIAVQLSLLVRFAARGHRMADIADTATATYLILRLLGSVSLRAGAAAATAAVALHLLRL